MKIPSSDNPSRRQFLKRAAALAGTIAIAGVGATVLERQRVSRIDQVWRLNPGFRLGEMSPEEVELFSQLGDGRRLQHRFSGLEADLLREIEKERKIDGRLFDLAEKYGMSEGECRRQLRRMLMELDRAKLIYTGEKMLVKKVEINHG